MADPITLIVPLSHAWTSPAEIGRAVIEFARRGDAADRPGLGGGRGRKQQPIPLQSSANGSADTDGLLHEEETWVPAVKPAMLKDQPMILEHAMGESHTDARRALNDALEDRGLSTRDLRVVLEVPGPASVAAAVADGLGIGLVPQSVARLFVGQIVPVRVEGLALVQHVYLIRDRKALNSPAVGAWWQFVEGKSNQQAPETSSPPEEMATYDVPADTPSLVASGQPVLK
jgi:hypothetical protein